MRAFLIALGVVVAGAVAGLAFFYYAFMRALSSSDPLPVFMTDYQSSNTSFSEFAAKAFPIGSDAKSAISQITGGGFKVTKSSSDSVELLWNRHAGPCREEYSIVVNQSTDGRIARINGRRGVVCL